MTRKELKQQIKEEQKERATTIRILKAARKPKVYNSNPDFYNKLGYLGSHQWSYRHIHIAYCKFFNNTPYERIERNCDEFPHENTIDEFINNWVEEIGDEIVCVG